MADENKAMIRRGISTVVEVETAINEKAREKYVDAQDAATLDTAKNYADEREAMIRTDFEQGDADVLTEAAKALTEAIAVLKGGASVDYDTFKKLQTKIETINEAISGTATPDTIDTLNEALAFIREHQGEIESLVNTYVRKEAIANDLTTDDPTRILSAAQGVALKALIDAVAVSLDGYVEKVNGAGLMTDEEREKLSGIEEGANAYELPTASGSVLGGVKVGAGLEIAEDGTLSAPGGSGSGEYVLPKASAETLGGIKVGNNLSIREDGTLDAQAGSGGSGTEKLVLPYIEPVYGDDGVSLTNKEAFIEAWGPVMKKYRAAPDSYRLFMELPSGLSEESMTIPGQTVSMDSAGQSLLLSACGVMCIPGAATAIPVVASAGALFVFDTSGEVVSVEHSAYAPVMAGTGMPNMMLQKVYINLDDLNTSGEKLKTAMQPYIDQIRANPMAEIVGLWTGQGWVVPMVVTKWMGDSDPEAGAKYILQGNLCQVPQSADDPIDGVSSFTLICDVDAAGKVVTASYSLRDSDWVAAEAMNAALATTLRERGDASAASPLSKKINGYGYAYQESEAPANGSYITFGYDAEGYTQAQILVTNASSPEVYFRYSYDTGQWSAWRKIWHAGNFDPAGKANAPATLQNADLNTLTSNGLYVADGAISNAPASTANCRVLVIATSSYRVTQIAQVYDADRLFFRRRVDEQWQPWREVYHTGNLAPATAAAAGLMSAEDRIKLNSVASALSLPVVTEDMPTTLEETDENTTPAMSATPQVCIRAHRAAQYQMQTDELLYDALEAFARNHPEYSEFAVWLEAKDRIRQEFPKPEATDVADGPETDGEPQNSGPEPAAEQEGGEE